MEREVLFPFWALFWCEAHIGKRRRKYYLYLLSALPLPSVVPIGERKKIKLKALGLSPLS